MKFWVCVSGVIKKLHLKGVGGFALSPEPKNPVVAAFVAESKGVPGFVGLWRLNDLDKSPNPQPPFVRRSFFKVNPVPSEFTFSGIFFLSEFCSTFKLS